jgi:hypothetical protein
VSLLARKIYKDRVDKKNMQNCEERNDAAEKNCGTAVCQKYIADNFKE